MHSRLPLVLLLLLMSCKPTISYFRAQPNTICQGGSANLIWSASAGGKIVEKQSGSKVADAHSTGSASVGPVQHTTYRLDASNRFGTTSREVDLDVIADATPKDLGASTAAPSITCNGSTLTVSTDAKAEYWDARVYAGEVSALDGRLIHVAHGGVCADVAPDSKTTAFKDEPVLGRWTFSAKLRQGEQCGGHIPRIVGVRIFPTCTH